MPKCIIIEFLKTKDKQTTTTKVKAARENWNINLEDTNSNH